MEAPALEDRDMSMHKKLLLVGLVLVLVGCSGGGGSSESNESNQQGSSGVQPEPTVPEVLSGIFAEKSGLTYRSATLEGVTGEDGAFQYVPNEPVTFSVGDVVLGQATGLPMLTLTDLDVSERARVNITRFLQVLDDDANLNNGIQISPVLQSLATGESIEFDQTASAFTNDSNVQNLVVVLTSATGAGQRALAAHDDDAPISNGKTFVVLAETPPAITTHKIHSGLVTLGISDQGGGYINYLSLPGLGDIMGPRTDGYGRGGQAAIRDSMHGGKYNPTMAGFTDRAGTRCEVLSSDSKLTVVARPSTLWNGDGRYDFTQWENLASDPYKNDNSDSDVDGIDESALAGRQATEVTSEFDYYGEYENCISSSGGTPCFRVYFEYRFIREPGHSLSQFSAQSSVFNADLLGKDISNLQPEGQHFATEFDLSGLVWAMTLRADSSIWQPKYRLLVNSQGQWEAQERVDTAKIQSLKTNEHKALIILSDSQDPNRENALGLYWPPHEGNTYDIVGRRGEEQVYRDKRQSQRFITDVPQRAEGLQKFGFGFRAHGILNPSSTLEGVYETLRGEMFVLVGTPSEIRKAANRLHPL